MTMYDTSIVPAGPVLRVEVGHPRRTGEPERSARLLIDTGADTTCIPRACVDGMGGLRSGTRLVEGYDGKERREKTAFVGIRIGKAMFTIEAIVIADNVGLLGRDVLNSFVASLDGPSGIFDLS